MSSRDILLNVSVALVTAILLTISLIFDKFLTGLFVSIVVIVLGVVFYNISTKSRYLIFVSIIIVVGLILDALLNETYSLMDIFIYFYFIASALLLAFLTTLSWEKSTLLKKLMKSLRGNNFQEVLDCSNRLLEIDSENYLALASKAGSLKMLGKYHDSLKICNSFLEKKPNDFNFLNLKVDALINLKKIDEAEEVNNKILSKNSKDLIAISNKAQILFEKGYYQDSIDNFEKSVKMMDNKEKWIFVGLKPQKMIPVTSEIVRMWIMKGEAHKNLQQYPEALESFNKALEFDSDSLEAQKNKDEVSGLLQGI